MISVADIQAGMTTGPASTGDNAIIQNKINQAIAYITAGTGISASASGDSFLETPWLNRDGDFWISLRVDDATIGSIIGCDSDGTETTLTTADYLQYGPRQWRVTGTYTRVKVTYTSNFGSRMVNEIIKDIAMYEYLKEPKKTGALNKTSEGAGQVTISYIQPVDFYQEIDRRIDRLFLRY